MEWHPEVATQMCLASEDDNSPVIQLWDLRYATAPLKVIQGHQQGILGMAWCPQDPDLLLTCGKEARILCWNPNYPYPVSQFIMYYVLYFIGFSLTETKLPFYTWTCRVTKWSAISRPLHNTALM